MVPGASLTGLLIQKTNAAPSKRGIRFFRVSTDLIGNSNWQTVTVIAENRQPWIGSVIVGHFTT